MNDVVLERRTEEHGLPIIRVSCRLCGGTGSRWQYDYDSDPYVEWRLLGKRLKRLFLVLSGRKP